MSLPPTSTAVRCAAFTDTRCPLCERLAQDTPPPFRTTAHRADETLLRAGSDVRQIYYVRSGNVRLSVADASGAERAGAIRTPGAFIGLEGLIGRTATLDARTESASVLCSATPAELLSWARADAGDGVLLLRHAVAEGARLGAERLLVQGNSEARLARFLLERETNQLLSGWKGAARHDVAGLLAMRPETLSRAIRVLQQRNIIDAGLAVLDHDALRQSAHEAGVRSEQAEE